jgi:hypothetical protein
MLTDMILWSLPLAALVFLGGWAVRRKWPRPLYFVFYLLGVIFLLIIITIVSSWIPTQYGLPLVNMLAIAIAPVILGVLALLALHLRPLWAPSRKDILVLLVLVVIAIPASRLPWSGDLAGMLAALLVFALLLWLIARRGPGYLVLLTLACLAFLFYVNNLPRPPLIFGNLWPVIYFSMHPLLVAVLAALVYRSLRPQPETSPQVPSGLRLTYLALGALLLGYFAYTIYWTSIWDHTSDGLGGLFFSLYGSITAVAAGLVMAYLLPGQQRLAGIVFALLVPLSLNWAFDRGWQISYHKITEDRAVKIETALDRYSADHGRYPQDLDALSPRYLLSIPRPVILRTVGWCYRAGEHHYRLGTFYREFFSLPISFRLYAQAGDPPDDWACEELHDEVIARYGRGRVY